jgi:hypothetical protein
MVSLEAVPSIDEDRALMDRIYASPAASLRVQLARARTGEVGAVRMAREIARLAIGAGRLKPQEYFYYGLYDPALSMDQKLAFVGKREQPWIHLACNDRSWSGVCNDKLLFYSLLSVLGFPMPRLLALYSATRLAERSALHMRTTDELWQFLLDLKHPVFAKPVDGVHSIGSMAIEQIDAKSGTATLATGAQVSLESIVRRIDQSRQNGFLIQEKVRPHPQLQALTGTATVSCVRVVVLMSRDGPEIFRTQFKIPVGRNAADNFWRGNMLAAVDPETGEIVRVVKGTGAQQTLPATHPDTGLPLIGFALPCWSELKGLVLQAACALPRIGIQAWDIAMSESGPLLMECNSGGDFSPPQLAWGEGVLDERFRAFLRERGYRPRPLARIPLAVAKSAAAKVGIVRKRRTKNSRHL